MSSILILNQAGNQIAAANTIEDAERLVNELGDDHVIDKSSIANNLSEKINKTRDASLTSGLIIKGIGELDTDPKSIQRISGATTLALLPVIVSQHKFNLSRAKAEEKKTLQAAWDSFKTPWVTRTGEQVLIGLDQLIVIAQELAKNETLHVITARKAKDQLAKADDPQTIVQGFHKELEAEKAKLGKKESADA